MIDLYCDCADLAQIKQARANPLVKGFTTNPTLMRAAGVTDYEAFCHEALEAVDGLPISFEVFSDDLADMERQARKLASFAPNVNVKIPVSNTKGIFNMHMVRDLSDEGVICNVTAVTTQSQAWGIISAANPDNEMIISVFAGRIADTGIDPILVMNNILHMLKLRPKIKILWASPREVLNIYQAYTCGCHIITITPDMLKKYEQLKGKDLTEFSLDTVNMFYNDAQKAGYTL
jgi:transaldolase